MSERKSSPASFLISTWSFCVIFALFCGLSGCAKTDTSNYVSESDIITQKVEAFGSEGTVVEIYTFRSSLVVVLENDRGDRIRAYANSVQTPIKGDRWKVLARKSGYSWPYLDQQISD